jgi:hypothetical protein
MSEITTVISEHAQEPDVLDTSDKGRSQNWQHHRFSTHHTEVDKK